MDAIGEMHPVERILEVFTSGETSGKILKEEVVNI